MGMALVRRWSNGLAGGVDLALGCLLLAGCGSKDNAAPPAQSQAPAPAQQAPQGTVTPTAPPSAVPTTTPVAAPAKVTPELVAHLHQAFKDATLSEPPGEDHWLPRETKTHKSVGKLYETVVAAWDDIRFVTAEGKRLQYTALITTDLGPIKIELWPEVAPNHVRNFVALARAGYYNDLQFDRTVQREPEDKKGETFRYIEGGCPLCSGEVTFGSIGYWLKPEISGTLKHEEGSVGAWHAAELESAACKFYITLSRAEWMDGNFTLFGKITQGLEVARAIHERPVCKDDIRDRPVHPVVIHTVTIECREQP